MKRIEALRQETERRAYLKYCDRGCEPGRDLDDWLAAEQEVLGTPEAAPAEKSARRRKQGAKRR